MDKGSIKLKIVGKELSWGLHLWTNKSIFIPKNREAKTDKNFGFLLTTYNVGSKKIDEKYLLITDNLNEKDKIFGIADNFKEAEERLYKQVLRLANKIKERYKENYEKIEIIDETKYAKNLESKL